MTYTKDTILEVFKELGKEQFREIYKNHGYDNAIYGVSMADLKNLQREIKTDTNLALELWETGSLEARILAILILNPDDVVEEMINDWLDEMKFPMLIDIFITNIINKTPYREYLSEKWINSEEENISRAGWQLMALIAMHQKNLPDLYFEKFLGLIEKNIHKSKNRCKDAMNNALIGIGLRNDKLEKKAFEVASKIGKIEVDYGDTSCKTPDATEYIKKAKARRKK